MTSNPGGRGASQAATRILAFCYLYIYFGGVAAIVVARELFRQARPEFFIDRAPTISKTATVTPAYEVFAVGMGTVSLCVLIIWVVTWRMHRQRIATLDPAPRRFLHAANTAALALGWVAGLSLGLQGLISLEQNDPIHMILAIVFFPAQVMAFFCETLVARNFAHRLGDARPPQERRYVAAKSWLCLLIGIGAVFFLIMFKIKDAGIFADDLLVRQVYIASEYALAVMCLAYPALVAPVFMAYRRSRAAPMGSGTARDGQDQWRRPGAALP